MDVTDISALKAADVSVKASVSMLKKAMDAQEQLAVELLGVMDLAALDAGVSPYLGGALDIEV